MKLINYKSGDSKPSVDGTCPFNSSYGELVLLTHHTCSPGP